MRRKLCSLALAFVLAAGLTVPVGAYYVDETGEIHPSPGKFPFTTERIDELFKEDGIHVVPNPFYDPNPATNPYCGELQDGLLLITTDPDLEENYIDKDGKLYDINQKRFMHMFPFHDGYAAATQAYDAFLLGEQQHQLFVDKTGNIALQSADKSWIGVHYGSTGKDWYTGRFANGKALVAREGKDKRTAIGAAASALGGLEYAYIDARGNYLTGWKLINDPEEITHLPLYNKQGVWIGHQNDSATWDKEIPTWSLPTDWGTPDSGGIIAGQSVPQPQPEPEVPAETTYGQSTAKAKGYTIENNIGYLLVDVTNSTKNIDEGDLFYILYKKFADTKGINDSTTEFLPSGGIRKIHYTADAGKTVTLRIPVNELGEWEGELTDENKAVGWVNQTGVTATRAVLAQAETQDECDELTEFFKAMHFYGEMELDYQMDKNGVTYLAEVAPFTTTRKKLDEKLSALTSQF